MINYFLEYFRSSVCLSFICSWANVKYWNALQNGHLEGENENTRYININIVYLMLKVAFPTSQWMRVSFSPHPLQDLFVDFFWWCHSDQCEVKLSCGVGGERETQNEYIWFTLSYGRTNRTQLNNCKAIILQCKKKKKLFLKKESSIS